MKHHYTPDVLTLTEYAFHTEVGCDVAPVLDSREHTEYKWVGYEEALRALRFPANLEALRICEKELGAQD